MSAGLDFSMTAALETMTRRLGAGVISGRKDSAETGLDGDTATPQFAARMWPFNTVAPQWSGAGTYDVPQVFGPKDGFFWHVITVQAATFTAGSVNMFKGLPADNNLKGVFLSAGVISPSKMFLLPGDRLTFTSAGITGLITLSVDGIQGTLDLLSRYVL